MKSIKIEEIIIHGRSLKDILDLHELFLTTGGKEGECANLIGADLRYVNLEGANLIGVNLRGANLECANLYGADLIGGNLEGANLIGANLEDANLRSANLRGADLDNANLDNANLRYADLRYSNLEGANLIDADLRYADLRYSNLEGANLIDADLRYSNLEGANLIDANLYNAKLLGAKFENILYDHTTQFFVLQCPEEGSFIGYKKAGNCIVKLLILEDSRRSSATTRKCRCDKAKVLSIENIKNREKVLEVPSDRDKKFIYRVGEIVSVDNFNEDRWVECGTGIHFFITKHEAENYKII